LANNYTSFSALIPTKTVEERDFVYSFIGSKEPPDPLPDDWDDMQEYAACEVLTQDDGSIWIHGEESGDLDRIADAVSEWQLKFDIQEPWSLQWADTCSKPRLDEFGGGAVFIHKGEIEFMSTYSWVAEMEEAAKGNFKL